MMLRASIVMACRNGEPHLEETLHAIAAQDWDEPWELVFADNRSTDDSLAVFREFAARRPEVRTVAVDASARSGKSYALNLGVAAASSDAIILCDSDDIPAAGWLAAMGEALAAHDFVSARNEVDLLNTSPFGRYRQVPELGVWRTQYPPFALCAAGATMGFTRRVFDAVGGFDVDTFPEDVEFSIQASLKGFELRPVPGAVLHYRLRSDLESIFRQARSYSKAHVLTARRYSAHGPTPGGRWTALLSASWKTARWYFAWRFIRGAPSTPEAGRLYRKLGQLTGQVDGVIAHRGAPTVGLPRQDVHFEADELGVEPIETAQPS